MCAALTATRFVESGCCANELLSAQTLSSTPSAEYRTGVASNPWRRRPRTALLGIQLSPRIQVVPVQDRVENERVAADRRAAVDRIVAEKNHVALLERRIDDDREGPRDSFRQQ